MPPSTPEPTNPGPSPAPFPPASPPGEDVRPGAGAVNDGCCDDPLSNAVQAACEGDERARRAVFDALWSEGQKILWYAFGRLGSAAHEDLLQEALVRTFDSLDDLRDPPALRHWFRITLRHLAARHGSEQALEETCARDFVATGPRAEGIVAAIRAELLAQAVEEVVDSETDEETRWVARHRFVRGHTLEDTARRMRKGLPWVRSQVRRFEARVREKLVQKVLEVTDQDVGPGEYEGVQHGESPVEP